MSSAAIRRYDLDQDGMGGDCLMSACDTGEYVRYEDYERLTFDRAEYDNAMKHLAGIMEVEEENARLRRQNAEYHEALLQAAHMRGAVVRPAVEPSVRPVAEFKVGDHVRFIDPSLDQAEWIVYRIHDGWVYIYLSTDRCFTHFAKPTDLHAVKSSEGT